MSIPSQLSSQPRAGRSLQTAPGYSLRSKTQAGAIGAVSALDATLSGQEGAPPLGLPVFTDDHAQGVLRSTHPVTRPETAQTSQERDTQDTALFIPESPPPVIVNEAKQQYPTKGTTAKKKRGKKGKNGTDNVTMPIPELRTQEICLDPQSMIDIVEQAPSVAIPASIYESEEPMSVDGDELKAVLEARKVAKTRQKLEQCVSQTLIVRDWMKDVKQIIESRLSPLEEPISGVGDSVIQACQEIIATCTNDKQREERLVGLAHRLRDANTAILFNDSEDDEDMTTQKGGSGIIQQRNQAELQRQVDMQEVVRQLMIVQRHIINFSATYPTVNTVPTSPHANEKGTQLRRVVHSPHRPPPGGILMVKPPHSAESLTVGEEVENVQFFTNDNFWKWKDHIRVDIATSIEDIYTGWNNNGGNDAVLLSDLKELEQRLMDEEWALFKEAIPQHNEEFPTHLPSMAASLELRLVRVLTKRAHLQVSNEADWWFPSGSEANDSGEELVEDSADRPRHKKKQGKKKENALSKIKAHSDPKYINGGPLSAAEHADIARLWDEEVIPKIKAMAEKSGKDPSLFMASLERLQYRSKSGSFNSWNMYVHKRYQEEKPAAPEARASLLACVWTEYMEKKKGPAEEWTEFVNELLEIWKERKERMAAEIGIFKAIDKAQATLKDLAQYLLPYDIHMANLLICTSPFNSLSAAASRWLVGDQQLAKVMQESNTIGALKMVMHDYHTLLSMKDLIGRQKGETRNMIADGGVLNLENTDVPSTPFATAIGAAISARKENSHQELNWKDMSSQLLFVSSVPAGQKIETSPNFGAATNSDTEDEDPHGRQQMNLKPLVIPPAVEQLFIALTSHIVLESSQIPSSFWNYTKLAYVLLKNPPGLQELEMTKEFQYLLHAAKSNIFRLHLQPYRTMVSHIARVLMLVIRNQRQLQKKVAGWKRIPHYLKKANMQVVNWPCGFPLPTAKSWSQPGRGKSDMWIASVFNDKPSERLKVQPIDDENITERTLLIMTLPTHDTKGPSVCFSWGEYLKLRQQGNMKKKGMKATTKGKSKAKDPSDSDSSPESGLEPEMKNMRNEKQVHISPSANSNRLLVEEPATRSTDSGIPSNGQISTSPKIGQKRPLGLGTGSGKALPRPFKHIKLNHSGSLPTHVPDIFGPGKPQHSNTSVSLPSNQATSHPQQHIQSVNRPNNISSLFNGNESLIPTSFNPAFSGFAQPFSSQSRDGTDFPTETRLSFPESFVYGSANAQPLLPLETYPQWLRPAVQFPGSFHTMQKTDQHQGSHIALHGSEADMHSGGPQSYTGMHAGQPNIQQQQLVHPALQGNVMSTQIGTFNITPSELQKIIGMRAQEQGSQNAQLMGSRGA